MLCSDDEEEQEYGEQEYDAEEEGLTHEQPAFDQKADSQSSASHTDIGSSSAGASASTERVTFAAKAQLEAEPVTVQKENRARRVSSKGSGKGGVSSRKATPFVSRRKSLVR